MRSQTSLAEPVDWEALLPPAIVGPEPRVTLVNGLDLGHRTPELDYGARIDEYGRRRRTGQAVSPALVASAGWSALADPVHELMASQEEPAADPNLLAERLLRRLPLLERLVVRFRFGIGDSPPLSQLQVAERLGIARRTVQSLEYRALEQLRDLATGGIWSGVGRASPAVPSCDDAADDEMAA